MEGHNKWVKAIVMLIIGIILFFLSYSYPQNPEYIWEFIGILIVLKGIMVAVMPCDKKKR